MPSTGYVISGSPATFSIAPATTTGYSITGFDASFAITAPTAGYVLTGFNASFLVLPVSVPVPPVSLGGAITTRRQRRIRAPAELVLSATLYIDSDSFPTPSIELTEDDAATAPPPPVAEAPLPMALLTLVEARPPRSVVFAKPRIAKLRPVAEPHKVAASDRILVSLVPGPDREATNAVVSDEEIMLILLEAA